MLKDRATSIVLFKHGILHLLLLLLFILLFFDWLIFLKQQLSKFQLFYFWKLCMIYKKQCLNNCFLNFLIGLEEGVTSIVHFNNWISFIIIIFFTLVFSAFSSVKTSEKLSLVALPSFPDLVRASGTKPKRIKCSERYVQWILFFQTDKRSLRVIFSPFERWIKKRTSLFLYMQIHWFTDLKNIHLNHVHLCKFWWNIFNGIHTWIYETYFKLS